MKASTKRILSILASILFVVGSFAVFASLIRPAFDDIIKKRAEVDAKVRLQTDYKNSLARVKELQTQYQSLIQSQQIISSVLPLKENLPMAVYQVTSLAALNRLKIDFLTEEILPVRPSAAPAVAKGIGGIRINIRLSGDYPGFKSYLQNLETNVNLIDLKTLVMDVASQIKSGAGQFSYTMTVDTHYQTE